MIDAPTQEAIKSRADIKSVVEDYLTLEKRGEDFVGLCPFHDDSRPTLTVSPGKNYCYCNVCRGGGNPIGFVMQMERVGTSGALRLLARKYHITISSEGDDPAATQEQKEQETLRRTSTWLHQHFLQNLRDTPEGQQIGLTYYAQKRGFGPKAITKFQLGYALKDRQWYTRLAETQGIRQADLLAIGASLVPSTGGPVQDRFASRAIFPIHSISGQVIAFGGRTLKADDNVKYQNSPESALYQKRFALYGLFFAKEAIRQERKCYISEGYCDVISMAQAGIENIVAPCGTALTTEQVRLLKRVIPATETGERHVTMMYDGDQAGVNAALKNGRLLLEQGLFVHVVVLPPEDDPDTFAQKNSRDYVRQFLCEQEQDYVLFYASHFDQATLRNPAAKAGAIMETAVTIASIPDKIRRQDYIKECARILEADEGNLTRQVAEMRQKKIQEKYEATQREENSFGQTSTAKYVTIKPATLAGAAAGPASAPPPPGMPDDIPIEALLPPEEFEALQQAQAANATAAPSLDDFMPDLSGTAAPIAPVETQNTEFEEYERNIVHYLMKAGNQLLMYITESLPDEGRKNNEQKADNNNAQKTEFTVAQYILQQLEIDDIEFHNPVYQRIKLLVKNNIGNQDVLTESYFLNNSDPDICKTASEVLMASRYPSDHSEDLLFVVPRVVTDLKKKVVDYQINAALQDMRTATTAELRTAAMKQFSLLKSISRQICDNLGNTIVAK